MVLSKYYNASSLIESIIAISITSICFTIAFTIYIKIVKLNNSVNLYKAEHEIERLTFNCINKKDYTNNYYDYHDYKIEKTVFIKSNIATITWTIKAKNINMSIQKIIPYL